MNQLIQRANPRRWRRAVLIVTIGVLAAVLEGQVQSPPWTSGIAWPEPKVVDPGPPGGPPSDAIVLFDGKDLSKWNNAEKWKIEDGYAICADNITTKQSFGDCQLHIEWATPEQVRGSGQGRGNSGVFMMGQYEIQVLDSYKNKTYVDGQAGAIYKQRPPLVNACRKPGEWQSYDIIFEAPRFGSDGKLTRSAYVTILQNGVLVQNHFELMGDTEYRRQPRYKAHPPKLPIALQYHGHPVRYRNIWIRELADDQEELTTELRAKLKAGLPAGAATREGG